MTAGRVQLLPVGLGPHIPWLWCYKMSDQIVLNYLRTDAVLIFFLISSGICEVMCLKMAVN